ncbi:Helix-hairpin-helix motif protein [Planctomycetes bacterium CA13]|uniref:Helix-hairpin-helix motif protein n=1 Tax=Novipirellula herctigrandis TaxID=2527986 RepID=A0A5C5YP84_9BACT|nr:Helix-hairpin-helix motif protein [Planctomycetes bacterium CA13]
MSTALERVVDWSVFFLSPACHGVDSSVTMVGSNGTNADATPLSLARVQWTLVIGLLFSLTAFLWACLSSIQDRAEHLMMAPRDTKMVLDINHANPREFALLPTVGPVLADRIVHNRNQHGEFRTVAELRRVSGIGPKTLVAIGDYCSVDSPIPSLAYLDR